VKPVGPNFHFKLSWWCFW